MDVLIFGSGGVGKNAKALLEARGNRVVAFVDNDENKWGKMVDNIKIISPGEMVFYGYEQIAIGVYKGVNQIKNQLIHMGVDESKIIVPILPERTLFLNPNQVFDEELVYVDPKEYFSSNTLEYQNKNIPITDLEFLGRIEDLKEVLFKFKIPRSKVCIVSGAVEQVYGLRQPKKFEDIDIIMTSDLREIYGKGLVIVSDCAEMHPQNEYIIEDDILINDMKYHFVFSDMKFLTIDTYRKLKEQ